MRDPVNAQNGEDGEGAVDYAVGQVARVAAVSVRTLHHYDEIGLVSPGRRTAAGYRRYTEADLQRLQHVLFYRELGFALEDITAILDDPATDTLAHLRRQHELLTRGIDRLRSMAAAVEHAMEANMLNISLTPRNVSRSSATSFPKTTTRRRAGAGGTPTPGGSRAPRRPR